MAMVFGVLTSQRLHEHEESDNEYAGGGPDTRKMRAHRPELKTAAHGARHRNIPCRIAGERLSPINFNAFRMYAVSDIRTTVQNNARSGT